MLVKDQSRDVRALACEEGTERADTGEEKMKGSREDGSNME